MPQAQHPEAKTPTRSAKRGMNKGGAIATARARGVNTSSKAEAALVDPNKPLTDMQRAFVKAWASGESLLSAAYRAGYRDGGSYAYRMAAMPNILALYHEEKLAYERESNMTRKKVMDMHLEAFQDAKFLGEPSSMVAAAREIGKLCGYYEPVKHQVQVSVTGEVVHRRLEQMTDAQLLDLITGKTPA